MHEIEHEKRAHLGAAVHRQSAGLMKTILMSILLTGQQFLLHFQSEQKLKLATIFPNYYEDIQVSLNSDLETIERIFRLQAKCCYSLKAWIKPYDHVKSPDSENHGVFAVSLSIRAVC